MGSGLRLHGLRRATRLRPRLSCCLPVTPLPPPALRCLIFRVSGIRNRLSTKHTAGTAIG
jgi:hypothetical protein